MNKLLKIMGITGITIFALCLVTTFIGFCLNSETLFYAGITIMIFAAPAYAVVSLLILFVAAIIEEKNKKE